MKAREQARLSKIAESLKTIQKYVAEEKLKRATASIASLQKRLGKLVSQKVKASKPRAPSAFAKFVKAHYKEVAKANPTKKFGDITKILGKMYKDGKAASPKTSPKPSPKPKTSPKPKKRVTKAKKTN